MTQKHLSTELTALLAYAIQHSASDLHIMADVAPMIRIDGALLPMDKPAYTAAKANEVIIGLIGEKAYERLNSTRKEIDFSFTFEERRFRCNVFFQKGNLAASFRVLPQTVPTLEELGVPSAVLDMVHQNQGLLLVTGPTGHGKSTTLASILSLIMVERRAHIITIEDPIEFVFAHKKSVISQREVGTDTPSFGSALRAALREDPDVVLIGEMRDQETIEAALQIAETGHLVLASLHTNSAAQTADRIIDVFPAHQQSQVRLQLADSLLGIISQRLLPRTKGGRILASELMLANPAVRSVIREGKTHQLPNLIQTSAAEGMVSLNASLVSLVKRGEVSLDDATAWSLDPKGLKASVY